MSSRQEERRAKLSSEDWNENSNRPKSTHSFERRDRWATNLGVWPLMSTFKHPKVPTFVSIEAAFGRIIYYTGLQSPPVNGIDHHGTLFFFSPVQMKPLTSHGAGSQRMVDTVISAESREHNTTKLDPAKTDLLPASRRLTKPARVKSRDRREGRWVAD